MSIDDLLVWPILSSLGLDRLSEITLARVCGSGRRAVIIDKNKLAWSISRDTTTGEMREEELEYLSGKEIQKIHIDGYYDGTITGLSTDGKLYGSSGIIMEDHKVIHASTTRIGLLGRSCKLIVNDKNEVWHLEDVKSDSTSALVMKNCISVGQIYDDSEVYCLSGDGRLHTTVLYNPDVKRVPLTRPIVKMAIGTYHGLLLAEDGRILSWGSNKQGQLGVRGTNPKTKFFKSPLLVEGKAKFVDIAAVGNMSAAVSTNGMIYVWGHCGSNEHAVPVETKLPNLNAAFAICGERTHDTLRIQARRPCCLEPSSGDCKFLVGKRILHAHKSVLTSASEYFRSMFNGDWKESTGSVKIRDVKYPIYKAMIHYLYSGKLEVEDFVEVCELLTLAHLTMIDSLQEVCRRNLRFRLSVDNVLEVYALAKNLHETVLMDYCLQYGLMYMKDVFLSSSFREADAVEARQFAIDIMGKKLELA